MVTCIEKLREPRLLGCDNYILLLTVKVKTNAVPSRLFRKVQRLSREGVGDW